MPAMLLDTHAWALNRDRRLSARAADAIEKPGAVLVSPISFNEIALKTKSGRWPEMEALAPRLSELLAAQDGRIAHPTPEIAVLAATMDWAHRDPFDRMIAATAVRHQAVLVSADAAFDGLASQAGWPGSIW